MSLISILNFPRRLLWRLRIHRWDVGYPDPELRYLSKLCSPDKLSIDVGASLGLYTIHLLAHSRTVLAFEPRKSASDELKRIFFGSAVQIQSTALSDVDGETTIVICRSDLGRSTIEKTNQLAGEQETVTVITQRLDSLNLREVGFIKIDVEGHEEAVLRGSLSTIQRDRPNLLVEIEERHKRGSTQIVPKMLESMKYSGWFLVEGCWRSISEFDPGRHQRLNVTPYINNFIFLPCEREELLS